MRSPKVKQLGRKLTKSEQMARVRSKNTGPELLLRRALWRCGLRYRLGVAVPGSPDLAFRKAKVAVFVDGCFWHACPKHYRAPIRNAAFWRRKIERNIARDRRIDLALAELGWSVVRIWEHDLKGDISSAVQRVCEICGEPYAIQRKC